MGGSSKKQTIAYKYFLGMHMILCHGVIDYIRTIRVDDKPVWGDAVCDRYYTQTEIQEHPARWEASDEKISIDKPEIFGGDRREGGIVGDVDVENGSSTQGRNSYLQSILGSEIPSFRGVAGVVLNKVYLGLNPYLKKWNFRARRILKTTTGSDQWYDEKAVMKEKSMWFDGQATSYGYYVPASVSTSITADFTGVLIVLLSPSTGPFGLLADGDELAPTLVSGSFYSYEPPHNFIPGGRDYGFVYEISMEKGQTINLEAYTGPTGESDRLYIIATATLETRQIDMNPAHIIRESIVDQSWGMGYQAADVDDSSFVAAADTLYDDDMGMSILWSGSKSIEEFIQSITNHIDASVYVARDTGKFTLKLIRDDYDVETIPTFDETNVTKIENLNRQDVSELVSSVTVKYWDHNTGKTASLTVNDPSLELMRGYSVGTVIDYPGFTNSEIAGRAALRDLRSLSTPLWSCNVHADKTARSLSIGDVFKLSWSDYDLVDIVMRVTGLSFGDGKKNSVKITCVQDIFSLPESTVSSAPDPEEGWTPIDNVPTRVPVRVVEEAPYREIVTLMGDIDADAMLSENEDLGFLLVSGARPATGSPLNASIYVDSGAGYAEGGVMDFSPIAYLNENITKSQTTVAVNRMVDIDLIETGTYARLGDELVRIDSVSSSSLIIARGLLDTVPEEHSEDDYILFNDQYVASDETEYIASDELDVKLLTVTIGDMLPEEDALVDSVTMNSRAIRPYPPGNFQINGEYWPSAVAIDDIVFTWAHRDRTQQTSGEYFDFYDTSIGPEAGTTYTILIRDAAETILHTESGLTGATWTYTETALNTDTSGDLPPGLIVEIWSVRDGYASWQSHVHAFDLGVSFNLTEAPSESYNLTKGVL
jgi:hypothetical protein